MSQFESINYSLENRVATIRLHSAMAMGLSEVIDLEGQRQNITQENI